MKIGSAIAAIAASLTVAVGAGGLFFAPSPGSTAPTAPGGVTGTAVLTVHDDQNDPIPGVKVVALTNTANRTQVDSDISDDEGRVELDLPHRANYALYIPNPPDINEYGPGRDVDGGNGNACGGLVATRCVSVFNDNGVVSMPNDFGRTPLFISFQDLTPEPRINYTVQIQNTTTPVTGGHFTVAKKNASGQWVVVHRFENETGGGRTPDLEKQTTYRITFTPDPKWRVLNPTNGLSRTVEINTGAVNNTVPFDVIEPPKAVIEEPVSQLDETEPEHSVGGWTITPNEPESTQTQTRAPQAQPERPAEESAPVDAPADDQEPPAAEQPETTPPADDTPDTEETPQDEAPLDETPDTEDAPQEEMPEDETPEEEAPTLDELMAQCFMYLELYPELVELDPGLPFWCEADPNVALDVIRELRANSGN